MATEIEQVRLYLNDEDKTSFPVDATIRAFLDQAGSVFGATSLGWTVKAGRLAKKINVSTAQTRLELGRQHEQALAMALKYETLAGGVVSVGGAGTWESITMATADPDSEGENSDAYWSEVGDPSPI